MMRHKYVHVFLQNFDGKLEREKAVKGFIFFIHRQRKEKT